ncbi:intradiol ring-cleavage dioxygenase [Brevundimonas guildfordensis]|uniref:intradiol ring-cleavage dioxygenase n=1 Tax=Brevundimonas guildfordensis TaxID=2762241 RepID=UPI00296B447E|nr:intradiol ring-cleavage dioxygenase [Brevundimonas guildfordensis]
MSEASDRSVAWFDKARSAEIVNGRMGPETPARLREVVSVFVKHLHAAVVESRLTEAEWMEGIQFLTAVGHKCTDWRQEFILLSDVLGLSMLVDAVSHDRPEGATENTVLGPFYVPSAPAYPKGGDICLDGQGEPLLVTGQVRNEAGQPLAGVTVEVWQTNDEGFYDVQQPGVQPENNLRGVFVTDEEGQYAFVSVKPRHYPIPDDGPVGQLLSALGRHPNRPAHIHFIVRQDGYDPVTTHIFAPDCPYLESDPVFGVKPSLIAEFRDSRDQNLARTYGLESPFWHVEWDFVLVGKADR